MNVWVIEVDHCGNNAHAVYGVASSLDGAVQIVRDRATQVKFDKPASAILDIGWIMRGIWTDLVSGESRMVVYKFTQHPVLEAAGSEGK